MNDQFWEHLRLLDSARGELEQAGQTIEEISQALTELSLSVRTIQGLISAAGSKNWLEKSATLEHGGESSSSNGKEPLILKINTS